MMWSVSSREVSFRLSAVDKAAGSGKGREAEGVKRGCSETDGRRPEIIGWRYGVMCGEEPENVLGRRRS